MDESKTVVSSSSCEQVRLLDLNLPTLTDKNIKSQVQQTHSRGYSLLFRDPLLARISHIIKPATHFVDSILLDKKVTGKGVELESSDLQEFNSALSELKTWRGSLNRITRLMDNAADGDEAMINQIIDQMPIYILRSASRSSWDRKALPIMEDLVIKFVDLLELLLHGPNKSSINLASSMAALKENAVSIAGTPIEKFQQPLDQLNCLIKITLELIQYICELTLLSDTEYSKEDIVSMGVYWAIVSAVAGYIQINLIVDNGEVALELSHLISNLSQILNDLKRHYTICIPQIEEMETHIRSNTLFHDILKIKNQLSDTSTNISKTMKRLIYSKDGRQSLIDGSTMSEVDVEVLQEKTVLLLISDLDISTEDISTLLRIYEEIKTENYYKIVWIPFVLKWTQELRKKFENLKSKMPWYTVCYDSPIEGIWYFKGRVFSKKPVVLLINPRGGVDDYPASIAEISVNTFSYSVELEGTLKFISSKRIEIARFYAAAPPTLPELYMNESAEGRKEGSGKAVIQLSNPSSGFQGLLSRNKRGKEKEGVPGKIDSIDDHWNCSSELENTRL